MTGSNSRRRTISNASSVATGFQSACTRPKVFSSARSARDAALAAVPSTSDSGSEASTIAVGHQLHRFGQRLDERELLS